MEQIGHFCVKRNSRVDNNLHTNSSSVARTGHTCKFPVEVPPEIQCVPQIDNNVSQLDVNCINNGTNKSSDFALNIPYTCITCATANCSFVCTNGSNSDDYGFIPLHPIRRFVDLGPNHGSDMGYMGMHQLLCKSSILKCINTAVLFGYRHGSVCIKR